MNLRHYLNHAYSAKVLLKISITLIIKLVIDLVKAFIEYRILDKKTDLIDSFLKKHPINQSYQPAIRGWRRLYFLFYISLMPLHHWMISRSVKTYYDQLDKSQWLPQDIIKEIQEKKVAEYNYTRLLSCPLL